MSSLTTIQEMMSEEYGLSTEEVKADALLEDIGVDSLTTIEFMFLLEDKFKILIPDEPGLIKTVGDIAREVELQIAKQHERADPA
jgi:acyl carrier protein